MDYELAKSLMDAGFPQIGKCWTSWSGELAKLAANARFRGVKRTLMTSSHTGLAELVNPVL
jgi:hypothetical protein